MLSYLVWFLVFVVVFHIFVYHQYHWPWYTRVINKIPGPMGVFYFGSTLKYYLLKTEEMLPDVLSNFETYGPTFKSWYGGIPVVFVSKLEDIQTILGSRHNNKKGTLYKHILPWLGTGLLTSSGEKWQKMRKIITPTFHFSILHGYIDIFNKNAKLLTEQLAKEENAEEVDLGKLVIYCTLDIVCETAMGVKLETLKTGKENKYVRAVFRIGQIVVHRLFSPILFTDHNFWLTPMGREHSRLLKTLHGFTSKVIEEKRGELEKRMADPENTDYDPEGINKKKSFLEMLLETQVAHNLTDKEIREEVDTIMFEGHDTTSTALNWTLFELGHNMDVQEKVYEEMKTIFGDSDRIPTYNDLMQMSYLKRVIQETLRLYPSVPVISRKFDVDVHIKDYLVPANTEIILVLYYIHRNPDIFPEPDKFDPDRFLPDEIERRHPFSYVPFSAGQRNCIGQKFAMLEELVILSSIIRKFRIFSLDERESVKVVPEIILRPSKELRWKIMKR